MREGRSWVPGWDPAGIIGTLERRFTRGRSVPVAAGSAQAARVTFVTRRGRLGLGTHRAERCEGQGSVGMEPRGKQGVWKPGFPEAAFSLGS